LGDALLWVLRSWITCLPFIVIVLFWVVLARNMGPAMGVGIGTHTLEVLYGLALPFIAAVFANVKPTGEAVPWFYQIQIEVYSWTLGHNSTVFLNWGAPFTRDVLFITSTMGLSSDTLLPITPWRGTTFMVGYAVVFLALTLWLFRRRDIRCGSQ
jgi:ABC-type transport system involved in multi-copper enzyme maturation permease subunit